MIQIMDIANQRILWSNQIGILGPSRANLSGKPYFMVIGVFFNWDMYLPRYLSRS